MSHIKGLQTFLRMFLLVFAASPGKYLRELPSGVVASPLSPPETLFFVKRQEEASLSSGLSDRIKPISVSGKKRQSHGTSHAGGLGRPSVIG